jgi:hypothetical protein
MNSLPIHFKDTAIQGVFLVGLQETAWPTDIADDQQFEKVDGDPMHGGRSDPLAENTT